MFILRALLREKIRSAVAVSGIAAGVAVMLAIRLANVGVTETFKAAIDSVSGQASLRIRGAAGRFDELRLRELDWIRTQGQISPVVETYAMFVGPNGRQNRDERFPRGELLHVLGVNVLLDSDVRDYHVLKTGTGEEHTVREVLSLLQDTNSVILTEKFLRRHALRVGDDVRLAFGSRQQTARIRGVLLDKGPARTLDGNFALMDIAAAQLASDRLGLLDYADVRLEEGVDRDAILKQIQQRLPAGLVAEFPDAASSRADTMIAAFQFNLTALSAVALVVGLFLIYNTVAMSVAARRREIGILQAAGAGKRTVLLLFLCEAALLATLGVIAGLPVGRFLARYAIAATAQTVETFYIAGVAESSAAALCLTASDLVAAVALTIPLALAAALVPAWEAASVEPVEAIRGADARMGKVRMKRVLVAAFLCLAIGWAFTWCDPIQGQPLFGFVAELLLMLGGALLTPAILWLSCQAARTYATGLVPFCRTEIRLASANLLSSLPRVSVSVAALAVSLSMMVAIAVMVGSFRETVVYWLDSVLSSDLAVRPVMQTSSVSEARLSKQAVTVIRSDSDVADTVWFSSRQVPLHDKTIRLVVTELEKALRYNRLLFKAPPTSDELSGIVPDDQVLVSESFSILFDADRGKMIQLPTPRGSTQLRVAGVYYDYASNQGTVMMNADSYQQLFSESDPHPAPQHLSIYLRPGADPQTVRRRLQSKMGEQEQVYFVTNREVRSEAMRIFESTFAVTYALQLIAILVAGLGVGSTLITLIYQRQREIGLLSLIGATYRQTRRVILCEAVLLGGVSQLMGVAVGVLLALVLIYVINVQSFGWTIQFHLPWQFLVMSTLFVVMASALFGLYPAIRAANSNPLKTVREE